jgi:glycerol uptake facilitator-like aquaporin
VSPTLLKACVAERIGTFALFFAGRGAIWHLAGGAVGIVHGRFLIRA